MHQTDIIGYVNVRDATMERYQRYTTQMTNIAEQRRLLQLQYGMICHRSSLTRRWYHFATDFDRVLLQLVNILSTWFK